MRRKREIRGSREEKKGKEEKGRDFARQDN